MQKIQYSRFKHFLHKMRFQYRVSVLNENTLEESWHIRLSRLSVLVYSSSLVLATFILIAVLIFATPIRYYLPGYEESGNRSKIIQESMRVDSMFRDLQLQESYRSIINDIISGNVEAEKIATLDSSRLKDLAVEYLEKSSKEKEFVEKFENEEKYNLSTVETAENENIFVFFKPVKGVISSKFNLKNRKYGIRINTAQNETVLSTLSGTVINTAFTFDDGWVIQVQHENDYISIYKNNSKLLKHVGDDVRAGEGIAITGGADSSVNEFYFEIWKQGKPLNPEELIIF